MIILKNATYIDNKNLEFKETNVVVNEETKNPLLFTDSFDNNKIPENAEILDCSGLYVTKSFACGHHHAYSALSRGMPAPKKSPKNFLEILQNIWWKLDKCLDKEMIESSALVTALACAKAGVTFVVDHHSSPNYISGSLDILSASFEKIGISHLLCFEITDRNGIEKADLALAETERYLQKKQGLVGLHAAFSLENETLEKACLIANKYNSGIHIHVAEDNFDQHYSLREYKKRVVHRLKDFGILNFSKTILSHCIHLDNNERFLLKNSKAWIVENIDSNLNNKAGFFNSEWLGDKIMLGTDGMHSDMLRSAKNTFFVGQNFEDIDYLTCYNRFRRIHDYLNENQFSGDGDNNLVVLKYPSPTPFTSSNFLSHFIFGIDSTHIQHVISSGKLIVKDKNVISVNEREILENAKIQAIRLWEKMK